MHAVKSLWAHQVRHMPIGDALEQTVDLTALANSRPGSDGKIEDEQQIDQQALTSEVPTHEA